MRFLWLAAAVLAAVFARPAGAAYVPPTFAIPCSACVQGTVSVTTTTSTSLIAAPGAGLYIYVTHVSCWNTGSANTTVVLQNGSGGSTIFEANVPATTGGFIVDFSVPIGGDQKMTANTALYFAAGSATTSLICNAAGYKAS